MATEMAMSKVLFQMYHRKVHMESVGKNVSYSTVNQVPPQMTILNIKKDIGK